VTGAQKYLLMKLFMLATGDDPERDHPETNSKKKAAKPVQTAIDQKVAAVTKAGVTLSKLIDEGAVEADEGEMEKVRQAIRDRDPKALDDALLWLQGQIDTARQGSLV
jgi:hypothetical protein